MRALALLAAVLWAASLQAQETPARATPLQALARDLFAVASPQEAETRLAALEEAPLDPLGIPSETLTFGAQAELRASTLDLLLQGLVHVAQKWPQLGARVDGLVIGWNFCEVLHDGVPADLAWQGGPVERRAPSDPIGINADGFRVWGFAPHDPPDRRIPTQFYDGPAPSLAHARWVYLTVRGHCLPHPANGVTRYDAIEFVPPPPPLEKELVVIELEANPPPPPPPPKPEEKAPVGRDQGTVQSAVPPSSGSAVPQPPVLAPGATHLDLTGSVFAMEQLSEILSFGAVVRWQPYKFFFLRAGANIRATGPDQGLNYSWGLGYDDWHPGTFSLQLNNWGPIIPSKGAALGDAVLNFGYKLPEWHHTHWRLNSVASLDFPFSGDPAANVVSTFSPWPTWFVMAGVTYRWVHQRFQWIYGFGRWDWQPFTAYLTYYNWGPNEIPALHFTSNGVVTLGFNWAY